ncbi:MAG: hypothetical protein KIH08_12765 [Candidatus Freyarchaeota archaeon]|nr:hypothetical protein [Candidatus Jordarchaeia archaeon]
MVMEWDEATASLRLPLLSDFGSIISNIISFGFDVLKLEQAESSIKAEFPGYMRAAVGNIEHLSTIPDRTTIQGWLNAYLNNAIYEISETTRLAKLGLINPGGARLQAPYFARLFEAMGQEALHKALFTYPTNLVTGTVSKRYWNKVFELGRPNYEDAFIMWRKGLLPYEQLLAILREDEGMKESLARNFITHLYYDPSPSELLRIVRNAPVSDDWITEKLKEFGLDDTDLPIFLNAIKRERIKDEISRMWAAFESDYEFGLYSEKEVDDLLTKWDLSEDEKELMKTTAQLRRDKAIIKLLRDAEIYLYRTGQLTENQLFGKLQLLGIDKRVANAIVRLEAAKKGIDWHI